MIVSKIREVDQAIRLPDTHFYAILGDTAYLKRQYYEKLWKALEIPENDDFNVQFFSGTDVNLSNLLEACEMMPVFSEKKFVILRDIGLYKWTVDRLKELVEIIENLPKETVLIIADLSDAVESSGQKKKIQKMLDPFGVIIEAVSPTKEELSKWVEKKIQKANGEISPKVAQLLVEYCGADMTRIITETEKLLAYNFSISEESVKLLVTPSLEISVFMLSRAVEKGNAEEALLVLNNLERSGEEAIVVLGVLSSQYVTLFRAMAAQREGIPIEQILQDFSYKGRDFVVRNALKQANHTNWAEMMERVSFLEEADLLLKTGTTNPFFILETAVIKLINLKTGRKSA